MYRISRAKNGSCSWESPAILKAPKAGDTITDSPGRFIEDPGDKTIYFAPQWMCNAEEGKVPITGRATECANGVLYASADMGRSWEFRGYIGLSRDNNGTFVGR